VIVPPESSLARALAFSGVAALGLEATLQGCGVSAAAHEVTVQGPPVAQDTEQWTLPPGMVLEGAWLAGPGDQIAVRLTASMPDLDWDIHRHDGGGTQELIDGLGVAAVDYAFAPDLASTWYIIVRNHATTALDVDVVLGMYGNARWQGWQ